MWILADTYDGRSTGQSTDLPTVLNQNLQRVLITWGGAYVTMPGEEYSMKNCRHAAIGRKEAGRGKHTDLEIIVWVSSWVVCIFCMCFSVFSKFPTINIEGLPSGGGRWWDSVLY